MLNERKCQKANPFSEVGRGVFIVPIVIGKIVTSLEIPQWATGRGALFGFWLGTLGFPKDQICLVGPAP